MTDPRTIADALDGLVHAETQLGDRGVDLTAAEIHDLDGPGRLDFGGGELAAAATSPHDTERRHPDDDYGWWHLDPGGYLLAFNESLTDGPYRLQARDALRERGAFHPSLVVESLDPVPLFVGDGGLRVKENARVSTLLPTPP